MLQDKEKKTDSYGQKSDTENISFQKVQYIQPQE